ncbi:MAG TPA: hypothetical protein VID73_02205, partial [Ktedonobacterales bacterium]
MVATSIAALKCRRTGTRHSWPGFGAAAAVNGISGATPVALTVTRSGTTFSAAYLTDGGNWITIPNSSTTI